MALRFEQLTAPSPRPPLLFTQRELISLDRLPNESTEGVLEGENLKAHVRRFGHQDMLLDELLEADGSPLIEERRPILLQGELANPYRLQEINIGTLPLFTVRLEGDLSDMGGRIGPAMLTLACTTSSRSYAGLVGTIAHRPGHPPTTVGHS